MRVFILFLLVGLMSACGRSVTAPETACGRSKPFVGVIRNAQGDSVSTVVIIQQTSCTK